VAQVNHWVVCIDRIYFDESGDIRPVVITTEGIEARPLSTETEILHHPTGD
jgi:hypothetical protein